VAVGVAGLFIETHEAPDRDPTISDGPNMVPLAAFEGLMRELMAIDAVVKKRT
jgi:2-dehydro-3-deoxyphosphooctonate aldolase (KDO 8-P synthase)